MPGTVKSKNPKPGSPISTSVPDTRRLVLEPISVVMPPRIAAKLSGIIIRLGERSSRSDSTCMIGMKMTTTGVLLRKPLTASTVIKTSASASRAWPRARRSTRPAPRSSTPVAASP